MKTVKKSNLEKSIKRKKINQMAKNYKNSNPEKTFRKCKKEAKSAFNAMEELTK